MFEILNYDFMQNAIAAIFLISITAGVIGSLVVANRMVFVAGGIAHGAYGGIGAAFFFGVAPMIGATAFSLVLALIIAYLAATQKERMDSIIGALWAFGMGVGIIFLDFTPGYNVDLMSYLFGSLMSVSNSDLSFIAAFDVLIFLAVLMFYKEILAVSYDEEFAKLRGIKTEIFRFAITILIALSVVVTIRAVGLILVIALLSIPAFLAEKFSNSLFKMMLLATVLSFLFSAIGLIFSYYYNLTSGASIILVASIVFLAYSFSKGSKTN